MNRRWVVLALVFFGILISYVDRGNLSIAAASMMKDFNLSSSAMGTLLSAFFWTYAIFQIPAGAVVDRFGIRRVYAGAFLLWSLASAGIGLSRGLTDVLIFRMLLGMAEATGPLASISFIRQNFAGPEQGLPTAIYVSGQTFGPAIGALLGSVLLDKLGWRYMFILTGLGALVWLPAWLWLTPRDPTRAERRDAPVLTSHWPWYEMLHNRAFWAMSACSFLFSYYWYFVLTWVPAYLTMSCGFSTLEMGRVLSTPLFVMAVLNVVAGLAADRLVRRVGSVFKVRVAFAATGLLGSGAILLLLVASDRAWVMPILMLSVCSFGLASSNFWAISQYAPPSHMVGRSVGYLNTISQLGGVVAPLVTGWSLGPTKNFGLAILIAGVCPMLACGCLLLAGPGGLDGFKKLLAAEQPLAKTV